MRCAPSSPRSRRLGVDDFGLLLDDIPRELQHAEDRAAFAAWPRPTSHVANRVFDRPRAGARLVVCPTVYWGTAPSRTWSRWARASTRASTCSGPGGPSARRRSTSPTRRPSTRTHRPPGDLLGQLPGQRRGHGLRAAHRAVPRPGPAPVARLRPASSPTAWSCSSRRRSRSRPSPTTCAAPRPTTRRRAGGGRCATSWATRTWRPSRCSRTTCARRACAADDAPVVTRALEAFVFRAGPGRRRGAAADLGALADRLLAAADHLLRGPVANPALMDECRPWLEAFELGAQAMRRIADLAAAGRLEPDGARGAAARSWCGCGGRACACSAMPWTWPWPT